MGRRRGGGVRLLPRAPDAEAAGARAPPLRDRGPGHLAAPRRGPAAHLRDDGVDARRAHRDGVGPGRPPRRRAVLRGLRLPPGRGTGDVPRAAPLIRRAGPCAALATIERWGRRPGTPERTHAARSDTLPRRGG